MPYAFAISLLLLILTSPAVAQSPQTGRDVAVTAPDGTALKATYYASAQPGPAVLLLHMCNTTRISWEPLGRQLAAAGIHALAADVAGRDLAAFFATWLHARTLPPTYPG